MRFARYALDNMESYGVHLSDARIIDLRILSQALRQPAPQSLDDLINQGEKGSADVSNLMEQADENDREKAILDLSAARMLSPLISPPKIVCLGLNYHDHVAEQGATLPDDLVIFMKPRTALVGPNDSIVKPDFVQRLDYEAELAIVIGKKGKAISLKEAENYIFGYTCFNDISARDIQFKDKQWTRGKSFDTFAPIGPWITTVDQIGSPDDLRIQTRVNGELRQDSSTRNMVFNVYQIVHKLSLVMTLEPCDLIATGTPAGVGFAMKPEPSFLKSGDIVEIEIENIGVLRNRIIEVG